MFNSVVISIISHLWVSQLPVKLKFQEVSKNSYPSTPSPSHTIGDAQETRFPSIFFHDFSYIIHELHLVPHTLFLYVFSLFVMVRDKETSRQQRGWELLICRVYNILGVCISSLLHYVDLRRSWSPCYKMFLLITSLIWSTQWCIFSSTFFHTASFFYNFWILTRSFFIFLCVL